MTTVAKNAQINQNKKDFELFGPVSEETDVNNEAEHKSSVYPTKVLYRNNCKNKFKYRSLYPGRLFDVEEGKEIFNSFSSYQWEDLYCNWLKLKSAQKISLIKYTGAVNLQYQSKEGEKELNRIILNVLKHKHFPIIIAKLFFDIVFGLGFIKVINEKLKLNSWKDLSKVERIVILYDLICLYPEFKRQQHHIFDIAINEPNYNIPLVVKEVNRLAILEGDFESVYKLFRLNGWSSLSTNEKIVLTNGLCEKHRGVTEDLDQVLYDVRVYNEIPNVLNVESESYAIDRYLNGGPVSNIIKMIIDHFNNYGEVIALKGIEQVKIQATLDRFGSCMS